MANERDGSDERDENAPAMPAADDRTEQHLTKARELLREARSRLTVRDGEPTDAGADAGPPKGDAGKP